MRTRVSSIIDDKDEEDTIGNSTTNHIINIPGSDPPIQPITTENSNISTTFSSSVLKAVTACTTCGGGVLVDEDVVVFDDYNNNQNSPTTTTATTTARARSSRASSANNLSFHHDTTKSTPERSIVRMRSRSCERMEDDHVPYQEPLDDVDQVNLLGQPIHRRSQSDILDSQQDFSTMARLDKDDIDCNNNNSNHPNHLSNVPQNGNDHVCSSCSHTSGGAVIATLPRYPISQQRNKNCWSVTPIETFSIRGRNYFVDKKKIKSGPFLLEARGSDLLLNDNMNDTTNEGAVLDAITHTILGGQLRRKPTLAINFRFPWGYLNLYFEIPSHLAIYLQPLNPPALDPNLTASERTLAQWFLHDEEYRNARLKLIPYVAEGPWVVRNMVTGKPAIIGKKLPVTYHLSYNNNNTNDHHNGSCNNQNYPAPLLTVTLDIGSSISATAKRIVAVCRRYMSALTVDIGFVIQAETKEELPEQMLGAVRVHGPDPLKAPKL